MQKNLRAQREAGTEASFPVATRQEERISQEAVLDLAGDIHY